MSTGNIVSIIESPTHPNFSQLFRNKGLSEIKVNSIRKAINQVKKQPVEYIVAEFFYAYSTNYSGVHKSNLEVLLISLRKYSPATRVIVLVDKPEQRYLEVLKAIDFPLHAVLVHPVEEAQLAAVLGD